MITIDVFYPILFPEPVTSLTIFPGFNNMVQNFADEFEENTANMVLKQEKDFLDLVELRKKYVRLAGRIGYRSDVMNEVFEKQRKKTMRKLKQKKYGDKLKIYAQKDHT